MTALEKLAIELKTSYAYVSNEFLNACREKCPDEVFPCAIKLCAAGFGDDAYLTCAKCWLQEVSE